MKLLGLAAGGVLGTFARHFLSELIREKAGAAFPWGTLAVNTLGCFAAGVLFSLFLQGRDPSDPDWALYAITGFCGAFTTFSALVLESSALTGAGRTGAAAANIAVSLLLGFAAFYLGRRVPGIFA